MEKDFELLDYELDDKNKTYYVYRHISPNGKSYIGITKQEPTRRFQNGNGYKTQRAFYRAIQKYGWDSFKHEILEEGLTEKEAYGYMWRYDNGNHCDIDSFIKKLSEYLFYLL